MSGGPAGNDPAMLPSPPPPGEAAGGMAASPVTTGPAGNGRPWDLPVRVVAAWALAFGGVLVLRPGLPELPRAAAYFLSAAAVILLGFAWVAAFSRLALHRTTYMALGAVGLVLVVLTAQPLAQRTRAIEKAAAITTETVLLTAALGLVAGGDGVVVTRNLLHGAISDFLEECFGESAVRIFLLCLSQLLLATGIGLWIGAGVDEKSHLIPIALVATLADAWSVSQGATALIIRSSQIHFFLLRFPLVSGASAAIPFLIGLTDFLFFGIYFQAAVRFDLGLRKNILLLGAGFLITVGLALFVGVGLPVLPCISVLFVAGNWRQLSLSREDRRTVLLFLAAIGLAFWIFSQLAHHFG
ncbi:MAG: hypothetical protein GX442_16920 [Candidatus Riflebacteria bacterium]|nr:hypothetical protein [Candidatus Riflebacteria bacterium]